MHDPVRIEAFDLNLLVALEHLLATASVTEAARRAGTTQPAMSRTLARLRTALGDPLLVPAGRGVERSARAATLLPRVREALAAARRVLDPPAAFDPATDRATVSVAATDYATRVILIPWLARVRTSAPGLTVHVETVSLGSIRRLADGDLAMTVVPAMRLAGTEGLVTRTLLADRYVAVLRNEHPRGRRRLDMEAYASLEHIQVSSDVPGPSTVTRALMRLGVSRRIAVTVPSYLLVPPIVAETDLVATLPERLARVSAAPITVHPLPFDVPPVRLQLVWHSRSTKDPRHRWLRNSLE